MLSFLKLYESNISYPWVFWFKISIRRGWFQNFWHSRVSNAIIIQLYIFEISIGLPWLNTVLLGKIRDYGNLDSVKTTNDSFKKSRLTWQIGKYDK